MRDSNPQPSLRKREALSIELMRCVKGQNWYTVLPLWSGLRDLNPRSPGPKPGAIPNFAKPGYLFLYLNLIKWLKGFLSRKSIGRRRRSRLRRFYTHTQGDVIPPLWWYDMDSVIIHKHGEKCNTKNCGLYSVL